MDAPARDFPARLAYQPLLGFVEQVASKSPAPGGGSVAALSGALGAALLGMVVGLTVGKKDYAAVAKRFSELRARLELLRNRLTDLIDEDTSAFNRFRIANKLPEPDEAARARKAEELLAATREAVRVPQSTMMSCLEALEIAPEIAANGNVNTVSDAGTAAEMLAAGLEGAAMNVLINLPGLSADEGSGFRQKVVDARARGQAVLTEVRRIVRGKLGG